MTRTFVRAVTFALCLSFSLPAGPGGHGGGHSGHGRCASCTRNKHGHIKRSSEAKREFQRKHPCPSTGATTGGCHGYAIDHIKPLASGGEDTPSNMQWQAKADAKAKDKWERNQN